MEPNARDPWSSDDPWASAAPDPSPGWDEWPAPPPPDDYVLEEPPPPTSDPWAESWSDDAGMPSAPAPPPDEPPDASPEPEPPAWTEPESPWTEPESPWTEPESPWTEPEPATPPTTAWTDEPRRTEPPAAPRDDSPVPPSPAEAAPWTEEAGPDEAATAWSEPYGAPRIEAWSPDLDPWAVPDADGPTGDGADVWTDEREAEASSQTSWAAEPTDIESPAEPSAVEQLEASAGDDAAADSFVPPASVEPAWSVDERPAWPAAEALPDVTADEEAEPHEESAASHADGALPAEGLAAEPEVDAPAGADALAEAGEPSQAEPSAEVDATAESEPEAARRSWWRPAAAPVWPPEPIEEPAAEPAEELTDQAAEAAPVENDQVGAADALIGSTEDAATPDAPAYQIGAEAAPVGEPMPEWPAAESTQVLPPSWRAPRPDSAAATPGELRPATAPVRTRLGTRESEPEAEGQAEQEPSTAEQAVPWLIGVILLLAGMVIVLLALIFAGDASLGGAVVGPSPSDGSPGASGSALAGPVTSQRPRASSTPSATPAPSGDPTPTPVPMPEYGPLEMVYQGRSEPLAHIYLLHRDFTTEEPPEVLAQDQSLDVRQFAWAPDGTVGVALYSDLLVSVEPGREKRPLGDEITTATFGADATSVYAVRVTEDGGDDVATVLQIDYASGDATELASMSYARPEVGAEDPVPEAKFIDDGGPVRLFRLEDGTVRLWVLGGGAWDVDPGGGEAREVEEGALPTLWSPKGNRRVVTEEADGTTTLSLLGRSDEVMATTAIEGLVSHLRWSPKGDMVVFTVGTSASGGGVIQNLWVWYLEDGISPTQMTDTGAAFGAEWLGSTALWRE